MQNTIEVEKNIPMPRGTTKYPWRDMEVGDSFVADRRPFSGYYQAAKRCGIQISVRKVDDNSVRVWRIK